MGSCVSSVHKRTADSGSAAMNMELSPSSFDPSNGKHVVPPSPIKPKPPIGDHPPTAFRDLGSKEETFFDSQPWLDSDCEDDFYSINGDFTPSRGNTPVHHNFAGTPRVDKTSLPDKTPGSNPEPPPTRNKLKLTELFQQSTAEDLETQRVEEQNTQGGQNMADGKIEDRTTVLDVLPSANGTPCVSGTKSMCSSERTANGDSFMGDKPKKSAECCLPRFVSFRSPNNRKKKLSPAIDVNG